MLKFFLITILSLKLLAEDDCNVKLINNYYLEINSENESYIIDPIKIDFIKKTIIPEKKFLSKKENIEAWIFLSSYKKGSIYCGGSKESYDLIKKVYLEYKR